MMIKRDRTNIADPPDDMITAARRDLFMGLSAPALMSSLPFLAMTGSAQATTPSGSLPQRHYRTLSEALEDHQRQGIEAGTSVIIDHHAAPGDGGGFNGLVEDQPHPRNPLGGVIRNLDPVRNVRVYGHAGDWPAAFEAAARDLPATGGILLIPPGNYPLSQQVELQIPQWSQVMATGALLQCLNADAGITVNPEADWSVTHDSTTLRGFHWYGGQFVRVDNDQTGTGLRLPRLRTMSVKAVHFTGFEVGLQIIGKDTHLIEQCHFFNNTISLEYPEGYYDTQELAGNSPLDITVFACHFSVRNMTSAIQIRDKAIAVRILHNTIAGATTTGPQLLFTDGPSNIRAESYLVQGNQIEQISSQGAISFLAPNDHGVRHITICDNNFSSNEPGDILLIRLQHTQNVQIGRNALFLANAVSSADNTMRLVDVDDSSTDVWIDYRQYTGGATDRISLVDRDQFRHNRGLHLSPDRIHAEHVAIGWPFDGQTLLPDKGKIQLEALKRHDQATILPMDFGVPPRRLFVQGHVELLPTQSTYGAPCFVRFLKDPDAVGTSENQVTFQLTPSAVSVTMATIATWIDVDSSGSFAWAIMGDRTHALRSLLHITDYQY